MTRPTVSMPSMPKFTIKDFMSFPVILVATLGAGAQLLQWSGHTVVSQDEVHAVALAKSDSVQVEILKLLRHIQVEMDSARREDAVLREASVRGECLENNLEMLARQGLLNACQERSLLIGRSITPAVAAAASAAPALTLPSPARSDTIP